MRAGIVRQQRIFKHSPSRAAGPAAHDPQVTAPAAPQAPGHFFAQHSCLVSWPCTPSAAAARLTGRGWCGICRSRCASAVLDLLGSSLFRCDICHNCPQRRAASHRRHRRAQNCASGARAQTWADPPLAFVVALGHRDLVAKVPRGTGILKIGKTLGIGTSSRALSGSPQAREG